jgi:CDP-6-deoxy-D-xylo-4-hexulose-3-dehydrase
VKDSDAGACLPDLVGSGPETEESLYASILEQVAALYRLRGGRDRFEPGVSKIHYAGRVFDEREMQEAVRAALDFWLTLGPYGNRLERRLKDYFDARDFALVNSGSSANLVSVTTLASPTIPNPLRPGDEVITPALTFPTTLAPIIQNGLIPVFVDCEVGTYNVIPDLLEEAVSPKTRAIMIPHTLGNPCDMDEVMRVVRKHDLFLVEDCCDALGGAFRDKKVGTFGDLATLSFYPAHHMTMGEGGGVVVNNHRLIKTVRSVRDWGRDCWCDSGVNNTCGKRFGWDLGGLPHGYDHKYIYSNIGYNVKPTDLQAAIGLVQFEKIGPFIEKRRRNFARYYDALKRYEEFLVLPKADPRSNPSWFAFPLTVKAPVTRAALAKWLEDANIETRFIFGGNILRQPGFQRISCRVSGGLDQTDRIMRDSFFIGVYPGLTDEAIDYVIQSFHDFFKTI